ncbi:MAG: hypothetical protein ABIP48_04140 [Planctomycetota bacterium]
MKLPTPILRDFISSEGPRYTLEKLSLRGVTPSRRQREYPAV